MTEYETTSAVMQTIIAVGTIFMAVGTILVAVLAIFGEGIRGWLFRPKLKVWVENKSPFVELCKVKAQSSSAGESEYLEIRLQVLNRGHGCARNCKAVVDCIYEQRQSGDLYKKTEFLPREFMWDQDRDIVDLLPKVPSYVIAARIEESKHMTIAPSEAETTTEPAYSLFLFTSPYVTEGLIDLGRRKHVFPLVIYCDNLGKPLRTYVELFWDGKGPQDTDPAHFYVKLHTEKDFEKQLGGAP